jgi:hypothetical protein
MLVGWPGIGWKSIGWNWMDGTAHRVEDEMEHDSKERDKMEVDRWNGNRVDTNRIGWKGIGRKRRQDRPEYDEMVKTMWLVARLVTNTTGTQEIKPFSHFILKVLSIKRSC